MNNKPKIEALKYMRCTTVGTLEDSMRMKINEIVQTLNILTHGEDKGIPICGKPLTDSPASRLCGNDLPCSIHTSPVEEK